MSNEQEAPVRFTGFRHTVFLNHNMLFFIVPKKWTFCMPPIVSGSVGDHGGGSTLLVFPTDCDAVWLARTLLSAIGGESEVREDIQALRDIHDRDRSGPREIPKRLRNASLVRRIAGCPACAIQDPINAVQGPTGLPSPKGGAALLIERSHAINLCTWLIAMARMTQSELELVRPPGPDGWCAYSWSAAEAEERRENEERRKTSLNGGPLADTAEEQAAAAHQQKLADVAAARRQQLADDMKKDW